MFGKRLPPGQRLLAVFVLTIFGPGLLLAVFGARALWQERHRAEQQLQARLDHGGEAAVRTLGDEFSTLQSLVDQDLPPEKAFRDLRADGSWAYVESKGSSLRVYPPNILPYELVEQAAGARDPKLDHAVELEMRESDPDAAVRRYRDLLTLAAPPLVPEIKHRLARALRDAGKGGEAAQLWREIESAGGRIGVLPAELVAGFELASTDKGAAHSFYRHLVEGRWRVEKARYLFYLGKARERLALTDEADDPRSQLAEAVEAASASSSRFFGSGKGLHFAFRRESPAAVLVVNLEFFKARVWPRLLAISDADVAISRIAANGQALLSVSQEPSSLVAARTLDAAGLSWRVEVEPKDAAGFYAATNRTTNLYLAMLTVVVVLLAFGGYFVVRTVRRELEVARMKSDFVSTVSHEFRSPLTGIRQLGEMLARDRILGEDKRHQYYELIVRESDRLARLVENALDFARMEDGRKQYRFEPLDTTAWLGVVVDEFQLEANRTGHKLDATIPERLPAIRGDREALSTALRNLLDNACKYSPHSETIWLNAEAVNGGVRVQVRDRGAGIPVREQERIFEKFYRGGGEMAKRVKGAGLGLSLVQHIVEAHDGQITVESSEGEGSTFSVHLAAIP